MVVLVLRVMVWVAASGALRIRRVGVVYYQNMGNGHSERNWPLAAAPGKTHLQELV